MKNKHFVGYYRVILMIFHESAPDKITKQAHWET